MNRETYQQLLSDLRDESDSLTARLSGLTAEQWQLDTPAAGWTVGDQVTHLAFFDDATLMAIRSPDDFRAFADALMVEGMDFPDRVAESHRILTAQAMLTWLTGSRAELLDLLTTQDPKARLPWFGPEMSTASCATARLMETWAHGRDIYDAVGVEPPASPGVRSIAHLGVSTFAFSHVVHGIAVPDEPVYVELCSATGQSWSWGPPDATNRVGGPAEDFALVVTQRRHWAETALTVDGPVATQWLDIAQAFAGAPTRRGVPR